MMTLIIGQYYRQHLFLTTLTIAHFIKGDSASGSKKALKLAYTLTYARKYKAFYVFHESVSEALEEIVLSKLIK